MPSRRSRSRSRSRDRVRDRYDRSRSRDRSRSPEHRSYRAPLPDGVEPISEVDYFKKSDEFRVWLRDEKGKYFDELSGDKARSYFRKFVKAWNRNTLPASLYAGVEPGTSASANTAFRWSFAQDKTARDALRAARETVGADTYNLPSSSTSSAPRRTLGPTLPSASDRILASESVAEAAAADRAYQRKKDKRDARDRKEDAVGPKAVGKEGLLEKKRAKREGDRAFRDAKEDAGLEMDEGTLMGGGDSFRERMAQRDAARARFANKRGNAQEDRAAAARERGSAIREKDKATMDMFQELAKARFG